MEGAGTGAAEQSGPEAGIVDWSHVWIEIANEHLGKDIAARRRVLAGEPAVDDEFRAALITVVASSLAVEAKDQLDHPDAPPLSLRTMLQP